MPVNNTNYATRVFTNLVNELFEPELKGYYHHYQMVHVENSDKVIDGLQLIFVELPKVYPSIPIPRRRCRCFGYDT